MKTSENKRFPYVFRGYKKRTLKRYGLKQVANNFFIKLSCEKSLVIFLENCFVVAVCCHFIDGPLINASLFDAVLNFSETIFLSATLPLFKRMKLNLYYPSLSFI